MTILWLLAAVVAPRWLPPGTALSGLTIPGGGVLVTLVVEWRATRRLDVLLRADERTA